jgi:hypothetical protein
VASYNFTVLPPNRLRADYPDDITVEFFDTVVDTSVASFPNSPLPAKFRVVARGVEGDQRMDFLFRDSDLDGTLSTSADLIDVVTYVDEQPGVPRATWRVRLDPSADLPANPPGAGDVFDLGLTRPFGPGDEFTFRTRAQRTGQVTDSTLEGFSPYVVPNPYVGSASFEPERFNITGRGERRIEFRGLPSRCEIRIYTVRGALVKSLRHESSTEGYAAWDLRTKDNLELAPGLYIYHVDAGAFGTHVGKFGVVK